VDQVIVLHNGKVEDSGPPAHLQTESKLYRHLIYMEFNEYATGELEAGQVTRKFGRIPNRSEEIIDGRSDHPTREPLPGDEVRSRT